MKINNNAGPAGINPYLRAKNKMDNLEKNHGQQTDKVEISSAAKEMQQMSQIAVQRQQRVEELKNQVQTGTYKHDSKETAKSLHDFFFKK